VNTAPSLHRYLYAYANPTVWVDLDGYESSRVYKDENDIPVGTQYFNGGDGLYYVADGDYAYAGDKYAAWVGDQQANAKIQTKQDPRSWMQRSFDSAKETASNLLDKAKGAVTVAENEQAPGASDAQLTDEQRYERDFGRNSRLTQGANTVAEVSSAGADAVGEYCSWGCNPGSILKGAVVVGGTKALAKHEAKELAGDAAAAAVKAEKAGVDSARGLTLRTEYKPGLNAKEFDRKINRLQNAADNGALTLRDPHEFTTHLRAPSSE
jgi:hypothetical protein